MEGNSLIGELIQGMELAKQLSQSLSSKGSPETREFLVQRILGSYEKALSILESNSTPSPLPPQHQMPRGLGVMTCHSVPESPISCADESPRSDDQDPALLRVSKKRKALPRWTDQVRVNCENGLEGPQEDGFSWRKYGQKDILQAKYPRSYYRCTFRNTQSCLATKQVQRSDEDPYLFDITYRGNHTCSQAGQSQSQAQSQPQSATCQSLMVLTEEGFSFPPSTPSPVPYGDYCFGGGPHLGLDDEAFTGCFADASPEQGFNNNGIVSAEASATNSPLIPEMGFSLDHVEIIDPNFPYDAPGFFY